MEGVKMIELRKKILKGVKTVVIKIGTSVLAKDGGKLDSKKIEHIVSQVCRIKGKGLNIVLVSSGAIGGGMGILGLKARPASISHKQAAAAIGQIQLMKLYDDFFKAKGLAVAQVLLTQDDFRDKKRYLNAKNTLQTILDYGAVPVINENDTVAIDEIKFGDNDKLSSLVANLIEAQLLIILSDVDGLWDENKKTIELVERVSADIEKLAKGTSKEISTGGMVTKLAAAKTAILGGTACIIANGHTENILIKILGGESLGTLFLPN